MPVISPIFSSLLKNPPTWGRMVSFQMLWANIEAAERTDESAEDITAADTAPRPGIDHDVQPVIFRADEMFLDGDMKLFLWHL